MVTYSTFILILDFAATQMSICFTKLDLAVLTTSPTITILDVIVLLMISYEVVEFIDALKS